LQRLISVQQIIEKEPIFTDDTYVLIAQWIGSFGHSTVQAMEIAQVLFFTTRTAIE